VLPHRESVELGKVEEERRLMYVGITRAQRSLNVTFCERRKQGREIVTREPSRFIVEMGEDIQRSGQGGAPAVTKDEGRAKLAAFRALLAKT
jgi:ATP-dependent DNA helicase Rep